MKIIPPSMSFEEALRAGYVGRIELRPYLDWLKTLPCDTCGAAGPSDPSHYNGVKGMGTKSPDLFSLPKCGSSQELWEVGPGPTGSDRRGRRWLERAIYYLLQAFVEGRLVWKKK